MEFVLVLELFKFANIWTMVFGWRIFSFEDFRILFYYYEHVLGNWYHAVTR